MANTFLVSCERRDGPPQKQGYGHIPSRILADIQGVCGHSMEGSLAAAYGELDKPSRAASWTISNPKAGKPKQHYPLESVTWANGSPEANKRFISIENEGVAGEPLTGNQVANITAVMAEIQTLCSVLPWSRATSVKEHNEMTAYGASPTACPSGRIPWQGIIAALQEDDMGMTPEERTAQAEIDRIQSEQIRVLFEGIRVLSSQLYDPGGVWDTLKQQLAVSPPDAIAIADLNKRFEDTAKELAEAAAAASGDG